MTDASEVVDTIDIAALLLWLKVPFWRCKDKIQHDLTQHHHAKATSQGCISKVVTQILHREISQLLLYTSSDEGFLPDNFTW